MKLKKTLGFMMVVAILCDLVPSNRQGTANKLSQEKRNKETCAGGDTEKIQP
jgi:hypothetical protein